MATKKKSPQPLKWYYLDPDNRKDPEGKVCERCKRKLTSDSYRIILHPDNPWYRIAAENEITDHRIGVDCHKNMVREYGLQGEHTFTPSEQKVIDNYKNSETYKLLHICRTRLNAGFLLIYVERKQVRKTKKHKPPFKYFRVVVNKWGKIRTRYSGNIWDDESNDIIDDFTKVDCTR